MPSEPSTSQPLPDRKRCPRDSDWCNGDNCEAIGHAGCPNADPPRAAVQCPYCEGEGCSECDGTGERHATYLCAGDGLSAVVHGSAPLTDEAADAITAVIRAAYDQMALPSDETGATE